MRPGRRLSAPAASLKRFTEVESATVTSLGLAPISRAILPPTRSGASIQPLTFQLRIRSLAPFAPGRVGQAGAARVFGGGPSELPSR